MKRLIVIILVVCTHLAGKSQTDSSFDHSRLIDSFKRSLASATTDSDRIRYMQLLNFNYETKNPDSSVRYGLAALDLSRKSKNLRAEARTLNGLSGVLRQQGRFAEALEFLFQGRKLAEQISFTYELARNYRRTGMIYADLNDFSRARDFDVQALTLDQSIPNNRSSMMFDYIVLADIYVSLNKLDSAQYFANRTIQIRDINQNLVHLIYLTLGNMYYRKTMPDSALFYYRANLHDAVRYSDFHDVSAAANKIAAMYNEMSNADSALKYALMAFEFGQKVSYKKSVMQAASLLADLYDSTNPRRSLQYYRISNAAKDSLFGADNIQVIQHLIGREESSRKEAEDARLAFRNRIRWYVLLSGLLLLVVISWLLYRNNRQKQKANLQLQTQKDEIQNALHQLKITQSQLIQAEKMASLGQVTAGIAHEIQNPFNFINNFSELNDELIEEAEQEINNGELPAAKKILNNLKENGKLILQHGNRADAIVKSMLQHSRTSSGKKNAVDLNALVEQCIRIVLQGIRSKPEWYQYSIVTELDPELGLYFCSPEEIGKVLHNLLENALQSIEEKKQKPEAGFEPQVRLSTRRLASQVVISVEDNGTGIPESILPKIFQPFFTTKSPGQGTGLGLSLSYDIITKGYQGEIKTETKAGIGSIFTIILPVKQLAL